MAELDEEFKCTLTTWEFIYSLCRDVSQQVIDSDFEPDVVVALARGGWFAGRCVCDFLGMDDLTSLKMEHYVGTAEKTGEPTVRYPMPEGSVDGKDVLIIDDIADTGGSIKRAYEYVESRNAGDIRTATLQILQTSEYEPDFIGERLDEWTWIIYPWNFIEDMVDLVSGVMEKDDAETYELDDVRRLLETYHDLGRIQMEIAQPGRLPEILDEMERRGYVESTAGGEAWRLVDANAGE